MLCTCEAQCNALQHRESGLNICVVLKMAHPSKPPHTEIHTSLSMYIEFLIFARLFWPLYGTEQLSPAERA